MREFDPKKPGSPQPPSDDPAKRFRETEGSQEEQSALAAQKRLQALEAIRRSARKPGEATDGQEGSDKENGSQEQEKNK